MEPQDNFGNQDNQDTNDRDMNNRDMGGRGIDSRDIDTRFTGISQNESVSTFDTPVKASAGPWKMIAIISLVLVVGLAAGLTFFALQASGSDKKLDEKQATIDTQATELAAFQEATGVDNASDVVMGETAIDLTEINGLLVEGSMVTLDGAFVRTSKDSKYEIARFGVTEAAGSGHTAYFFRALPDGEWKKSAFTTEGNNIPFCTEVTEAEIAAFDGVIECEATPSDDEKTAE